MIYCFLVVIKTEPISTVSAATLETNINSNNNLNISNQTNLEWLPSEDRIIIAIFALYKDDDYEITKLLLNNVKLLNHQRQRTINETKERFKYLMSEPHKFTAKVSID